MNECIYSTSKSNTKIQLNHRVHRRQRIFTILTISANPNCHQFDRCDCYCQTVDILCVLLQHIWQKVRLRCFSFWFWCFFFCPNSIFLLRLQSVFFFLRFSRFVLFFFRWFRLNRFVSIHQINWIQLSTVKNCQPNYHRSHCRAQSANNLKIEREKNKFAIEKNPKYESLSKGTKQISVWRKHVNVANWKMLMHINSMFHSN